MIAIGSYSMRNRVALAPMAGISDLPYRRLCMRYGAGLVVGEMIHSDPTLVDSAKSKLRRRHDDSIAPRSVQIVGNDPRQMAEAARFNAEHGAQIIDINMGCPAKKVCRKAAGSALLGDERLVEKIVRSVVTAVEIPVTLKIRTGIDPTRRNGPSIARIAEDAGVAMITVHGRTRACAFKGTAEHDTTAAIVESVAIPVLANGDISSVDDARRVLEHTKASGVMIGRAAQGAPWLPGLIAKHLEGQSADPPSLAEQFELMREHVALLHTFYGEFSGVRIARKHVGWFLGQIGGLTEVRRGFNTLSRASDQLLYLADVFNELDRWELAA
ncbi:MAG: tRNA dihydrouridine synthase DusB [Pseudomonadota bacterium]